MLEEQDNNQEFNSQSKQQFFSNGKQEVLKQIPHLFQILQKRHKRLSKGSKQKGLLLSLFKTKDQQQQLLAYLISFELIQDIMSYYPQNSQEILNQARILVTLIEQ